MTDAVDPNTSGNGKDVVEHRRGHVRFQFFHYERGPRPSLMSADATWTPIVDCYETPEDVFIEVDLAGIGAADVEIRFRRESVEIAGVRRESPGGSGRTYHVMELERGRFSRVIQLPTSVDCRRAEHALENGLLILRMPRDFNSPFHGCDPAGSVKDFDES